MKFEYAFEGMKLKVLNETFAGKVLEFYSRNREEFDRYEAAKPDNFYTTEYITATLKAEYAALLKGEFGRFFLFSDDMPGEILGSVSFFGVTSIKGDDKEKECNYDIRLCFHRGTVLFDFIYD